MENLKNKNIFIIIPSTALGDTLAWIPYIEQFRTKHHCNVFCGTNYNNLFKKSYSNIVFVQQPCFVKNLYKKIEIGLFLNSKHQYQEIPLQQTATDILDLLYKEIRPKIDSFDQKKLIGGKYVCIASESTAKCKLWNNEKGWQSTIDYLTNLGYKIVSLSINKQPFDNVIEIINQPLETLTNIIKESKFFIGLGSGLSWLAWGLNKKIIMISGFSLPYCEFKSNNYRVVNETVCHGCFNDKSLTFDRNNYFWCPRKKDFSCTKMISFEAVKEKIDLIINLLKN